MKECVLCNFGMFKFEGYCKVKCLMELVDKFGLLIFMFVDMLGVFFGIDVEECG